MTSHSIISGVVARSKYLMDENNEQPEKSWSVEAKKLLSDLEGISQSLKAADQETKESNKFVDLEKQIVQLSYNIEDVIEAKELGIQSKSKGKLSGQSRRPSRTSSKAAIEGSLFKAGLVQLKNLKLSTQSTRTSGTSSEPDLESFKRELARLENELEEITKKTPPGSEMPKEKNSTTSPAQTSHQAEPTSTTAATGEDLPRMEDNVREALLRQDLSVVCVWGHRGMGKTTLAKKVLKHREVRGSFQVFAWVPIQQECQTKKVLQDILLQLLPNKKADIGGMSEVQLTLEILTFQEEKRCLFVLEDIETVQDFHSIRVALLLGNSSKILITTPSEDVAKKAPSEKGVVMISMKPLTDAECFKILKEKASFDDHELETVGKVICSLSQGSPLLAVILGRSLKAVDVPARDQLVLELDKYRSQNPEGEKSQNPEGEKQVFGLCYHILSDELKPCWLYMGQFPEGQDIEVEKLHLLLEAEGLISPEDYGTRKNTILENLAHKKLVEAQENKLSMTRMYKSCKLHYQVRTFCILKGQGEEFFDIVDFESRKNLALSTCRLAIYLRKYKDGDVIPFRSQDTVKIIRSLLIFDTCESSEAKSTWPSEINDLKDFSRLRVLDFDGVNFRVRKVPRGIDKIDFLRYLSFRGCWLEAFPFSVSKFPCLETLDLRVHTDCRMTIPNNVLSNMKKLRHLYFPVLYKSDGNSKLQLSGLEKLEILVNFDTGACDVKDLSELKNLQILTAISEGNHEELEAVVNFVDEKAAKLHSSVIIRNFDCRAGDRVTILKKLLECKSLHSLHIEGQIGRLPKGVVISPNFTEMLFDGSEIKDDPVKELGNLPNLRSLVLSNDAFVVNEIFFPDASKFPELRSLKLLKLQYLEKLEFRKGVMPKLSTLVIEKCAYLDKVSIPEELHKQLQLAQGKKGDDVYSVQPLLNITGDTDQV